MGKIMNIKSKIIAFALIATLTAPLIAGYTENLTTYLHDNLQGFSQTEAESKVSTFLKDNAQLIDERIKLEEESASSEKILNLQNKIDTNLNTFLSASKEGRYTTEWMEEESFDDDNDLLKEFAQFE